jgi:hypothetical protein
MCLSIPYCMNSKVKNARSCQGVASNVRNVALYSLTSAPLQKLRRRYCIVEVSQVCRQHALLQAIWYGWANTLVTSPRDTMVRQNVESDATRYNLGCTKLKPRP